MELTTNERLDQYKENELVELGAMLETMSAKTDIVVQKSYLDEETMETSSEVIFHGPVVTALMTIKAEDLKEGVVYVGAKDKHRMLIKI